MKQRVVLKEDYDIFHFWNLSQRLGIKVKIGKFSPYLPNGRHLHLYGDMIELATGSRKVGVYEFTDLKYTVVNTGKWIHCIILKWNISSHQEPIFGSWNVFLFYNFDIFFTNSLKISYMHKIYLFHISTILLNLLNINIF